MDPIPSESSPRPVLADTRDLVEMLLQLDVHQVDVLYNGCGDEGAIDEVIVHDAAGQPMNLPSGLVERIEHLCEEHLIPDGYQNGEGGGGEVTIHVPTRQVVLSHGNYQTELVKTEPQTFALE